MLVSRAHPCYVVAVWDMVTFQMYVLIKSVFYLYFFKQVTVFIDYYCIGSFAGLVGVSCIRSLLGAGWVV